MRRFFYSIVTLCFLLSFTSCGRYHESAGKKVCGTQWVGCPPFPKYKEACDPNADKCLDRRMLEDCGERYTRRYDYSEDISQFRPKEGESYEAYFTRVMNTLTIQEYNIDSLEKAIESKELSLQELDGHLSTMLQSEAEMRIALDQGEKGISISSSSIASNSQPSVKKYTPSPSRPFISYVVQKNDTLQKISRQAYGTHTGWLAIYRFNISKMLYGPNRLEVGTILYIPNVDLTNLSPPPSSQDSVEFLNDPA